MSALARRLDAPSPPGLAELGGAWDLAILDGCRRFTALNEAEKRAVRDEMTRHRSWAIVGWAEGMASLAVRERDRELLVLGLVGLSLFGDKDFDARDAVVVHSLFARAAELIGEDADDVTGDAAEGADSVGRRWLLARLSTRDHRVPDTHDECGAGRDFAFRRRDADWNPNIELADFAEDD